MIRQARALSTVWSTAWIWTALLAAPWGARAADCQGLPWVAVQPVLQSQPEESSCWTSPDKTACEIARAMARIVGHDENGVEVKALAPSPPSFASAELLRFLSASPALREMNRYRIRAREIAYGQAKNRFGQVAPCAPNYVYLGQEPVFALGPVFADSMHFSLHGKKLSNVIFAEDAILAGREILTKATLREHRYLDLALAHELAHGLMQDLYGVDAVRELMAKSVTRDFHNASNITDPVLALVEGFAEGFEAYLGGKLLGLADLATPLMEKTLRDGDRDRDFMTELGKLGPSDFPALEKLGKFLAGIGGFGKSPAVDILDFLVMVRSYPVIFSKSLARFGGLLTDLDRVAAEFLKMERQLPIRENQYIASGLFVNFDFRPFESRLATSGNPTVFRIYSPVGTETTDRVYAKEGVVAHFVHELLRLGYGEKLFTLLAREKPADSREFFHGVWRSFGQTDPQLVGLFKSIFTDEGRHATLARLEKKYTHPTAQGGEALDRELKTTLEPPLEELAKLPGAVTLPPARDYWVEFVSRPSRFEFRHGITHLFRYFRYALSGELDRINLATAPKDRIADFVRYALGLNAVVTTEEQEAGITKLADALEAQERFLPNPARGFAAYRGVIARLWENYRDRGEIDVADPLLRVFHELQPARDCFLKRCRSGG